jgi:signal transduction histidine kinase
MPRAGNPATVEDVFPAQAPPRPPVLAKFTERQMVVVTALVTCTAFIALGLSLRVNPHAGGPRLLLTILTLGPVLSLRRWPLPVHIIATAATTATIVALATTNMRSGFSAAPFTAMLALTTYYTATQLRRRTSILIAAGTAATLGGALIYVSVVVPHVPVLSVAALDVLPSAAAWFIGDSVAARRRYLTALAWQAELQRAARAQLEVREERVRIARELHDVVAHSLTVMTVQAGVGRRLMARRPEQASEALASIETIGRTAQEELRVVLGLLRDEQAAAAALVPAPKLLDVKDLIETVRDSGNVVDLRMSGTDRTLSPSLELSIYRVIQEALTNVVKHAPGATAMVDLAVSDTDVRLEIVNDSSPAASAPDEAADGPPGGTGHGIIGMRERVAAFGGWLAAQPTPEHGFRVLASIPLEGPA